jgi:predicted transglutaminase-like cysteine proteinase
MKLAVITVTTVTLALGQACAREPFNLNAVPSRSADLIMIWRELQRELLEDESKIKLCRQEHACSPAARRFISIVDEASRFGGRQMIGHLNRSVNGAIPTTRANVAWLSPLAALSQAGDCKSYAVAKYLALADAGIAASDRRLVMLKVTKLSAELHLAVLVRDGERWLILDNRMLTLVDSTAAHQYAPLHEFDESGVRDYRALP